ncbi:alpha/beta fold hydrolase [Alkalicaulis satelles]|uniref:Alpha/beta fold hydrolase n=1 Tax=Alkalicaulis satelles TaxID=2609175 RepID=A0A5M6ZN60_9PROT|nr:alpha/beta fold hydrolase [Alkalicaulis satelles]KAA5805137.1 alpha/beta fold hydrolase [Alkalicaulis satelles]
MAGGPALILDRRFRFDGHDVRYGVMGPEDAPVLWLLHGTPFNSQVWRRIAPVLARTRRVVFHDLLGYGASDKPDADVSLGVQNAVFTALMADLGAVRPDVIAHDFGGATALRSHLLDQVDYNALMVIDPVCVRPWGSPFVQHVREHEAAFATLPEYMHEALLRAYLQTAAASPLSADAYEAYIAPWRGEAGQRGFYRQIAQMDQAYTDMVEPLYGQIRAPLHILWGEADAWIPIEHGRRFASLTPAETLEPVPGSGHLMQEDRPEIITAAAERFFARHSPLD